MRLDSNDFELFGLPQRFQQERAQIDAQWRRLQAEVHPDRFASEGAAAQRVAMQWSVRVNEAYGRLKEPLARAAYLCELSGAPIAANNNTAMPSSFLMEQMAWREALDVAATVSAVTDLEAEVSAVRASRMQSLARLLDENKDAPAAAQEVRALMFIERFSDDVQQRLDHLQP
jgi:molecular chaperone HscB